MCTVFQYIDANGIGYQGRTHEDPVFYPEALTYFPAGTRIESVTPQAKAGIIFDTKYPILSVVVRGQVANQKQDSLLEGVNDQGMTFTCNVLQETTSPIITSGDSKVLSASDLRAWALGNFQTVAQVKRRLKVGRLIFGWRRLPHLIMRFHLFILRSLIKRERVLSSNQQIIKSMYMTIR